MTMTKTQQVAHTPGPWEASNTRLCNGWQVVAPNGGSVTGSISSEANARLIAAAPELLEALKLCVERGYFDDEIVPNLTLCRWCRKQKPMHSEFCGVGKAEAAISKVEHGQEAFYRDIFNIP